MSAAARRLAALALALAALGVTAPAALAGDPVIVPPPDSVSYSNRAETPGCFPLDGLTPPVTQSNDLTNPWRTCLLPDKDAYVDWPMPSTPVTPAAYYWPPPLPNAPVRSNGFRNTRSFILSRPGLNAGWLGYTLTTDGYPLKWYDVGSGIPVQMPSGPYEFPLAGKYEWECLNCAGNPTAFDSVRARLQGTMYVIGPRAIMTSRLVAGNNSGTEVAYEFDATGSFVVDHTPHQIVKYEFDFQDDGSYDVTNTEGTAQATFTPGPHLIRVRVTDNRSIVTSGAKPDRTGVWPLFLEVPYVRPGNPEPNPTADNAGKDNLNKGVKFPTTKIRLKAVKRIKVSSLRRKGLSVRVSGLTKGDRIRARLFRGKRTVVASGAATTQKSVRTVRLRLTRNGKRALAARPQRLVIDIGVEGSDGYTATRRVAVRVSY